MDSNIASGRSHPRHAGLRAEPPILNSETYFEERHHWIQAPLEWYHSFNHLRPFIRWALPSPTSSALVLSCERSDLSSRLAEIVPHVVSIDTSMEALKEAGSATPWTDFMGSDNFHLPFRAGAFDAILD